MQPLIVVQGLASGRKLGQWPVQDPQQKLMAFLREHGIPVASSCDGEGVCRKCVVNGECLSCQTTLAQFLVNHPQGLVEIAYL